MPEIDKELAEFRAKWQEAIADESDGIDPEAVFEKLTERYELAEQGLKPDRIR